MVGFVVDRQCVFFAFKRELTFRDSVANAASRATKILIVVTFVSCHVIKPQNDVGHLAFLVWHVQLDQRSAACHYFCFDARRSFDRVEINRFAILRNAEFFRQGFVRDGDRCNKQEGERNKKCFHGRIGLFGGKKVRWSLTILNPRCPGI